MPRKTDTVQKHEHRSRLDYARDRLLADGYHVVAWFKNRPKDTQCRTHDIPLEVERKKGGQGGFWVSCWPCIQEAAPLLTQLAEEHDRANGVIQNPNKGVPRCPRHN